MKVKILERKRLLDNFFQIDVATLQYEKFSGGWSQAVKRFNVERGEAVAALIYLTDVQRLILIRQFRFAVYERTGDGWIDEIVAGVIDAGESPLECIRRECIEEAGYEINDFKKIAQFYSTPGITTEKIHLFIGYGTSADKKHSGGGLEEEHEDIQLIELTPQQAYEKILNGKFEDGKTILALEHFFLLHPELRLQ